MQKHPSARVTLSYEVQHDLFLDVCQRSQIEACGLLLGTIDTQGNWQIERVYPLRNIHNSPVYFEFAPEDLLDAELNFPGQIVGVYHSHPTGLAKASSTDRDNMKRVNDEQRISWIWLIISGPFGAAFSAKENIQGAVIAYHHYAHLGLRQVSLHFAEKKEVMDRGISADTLPIKDSEPIG